MNTSLETKAILCVVLGAWLTAMSGSAETRYVWQDSPSPTPPYSTWATAATNIQDAVDAAQAGDTVLVGSRASHGTLNNCILYYNSATSGPNYSSSTLNSCSTTPDPGTGAGNITNEPLFVDRLQGNLRLQSNSPCIDAGTNAYVSGSTDLDGRPRIVGGTVDIGAYEYQGPGFSQFIPWLAQSGLPTDGSADTTDPDGDRVSNWQEWRCGTDPANAVSVLRLLPPVPIGADLAVRWESVSNRFYSLERSTNLGVSPSFFSLATNLTGQAGTTTYTDTNAAGTPPRFYGVCVTGP